MTSMPEHKTTKEPPRRTPVATATTVGTESGAVTVQAGYEQFKTYESTGWTAPRPVVTATVGDRTAQYAAAEAEELGRSLMLAASAATHAAEANA